MKYSLLSPQSIDVEYKTLTDVTIHDLGMDEIVKDISNVEHEQRMFLHILKNITADPDVTKYRIGVFADIYSNNEMRYELGEILDKISFLKDYGSFKRDYDKSAGAWELMHRLDELRDYITCVESISNVLSKYDVKSEGLLGLKEYVEKVYRDSGFAELKKDIESLSGTTSKLKSITVGINLNDRFEADGIGIISINDKPFTNASIINNFAKKISSSDSINEGNEWNGEYKFEEFHGSQSEINRSIERMGKVMMLRTNPLLAGLARVPYGDTTQDITSYMDRVVNHMISSAVKSVRNVLNKYVSVTITDMTDLIPEFTYYVRFAEYVEKLEREGASFCRAKVLSEASEIEKKYMNAKGIYNIKLAAFGETKADEIVKNKLLFDPENLVYILTGANRGGKTTITQAIGQLFVLAQGGIFVPGDEFSFVPVDGIYTHFPADEDKTMDLGRLGEECKRFRELYQTATSDSLLLLNETFSTTSFEEGYYIARDSVKAILKKQIRTIYNTHMHKLAYDIDEMNKESNLAKAQSLVVQSEEGKRSYEVVVAPPVGQSYAKDIAEKYGVTFEMLTSSVTTAYDGIDEKILE